MQRHSVNILIGGEAGQGLATVGQLLSKSLVRAGYQIHITQDYLSRIRGGHNTFAIRAGNAIQMAPHEAVDVLVALDQESVSRHMGALAEGGVLILGEKHDPEGHDCLQVPFKALAGKAIFENVAALGVICELIGLGEDAPAKLLTDTFHKKGDEIVAQNTEVLRKAMDWTRETGRHFAKLPEPTGPKDNLMMGGNEAIALGAMAAGVKFCSFYPMTPATSVALTLIAHAGKLGIVCEQVEDEIAALNMALGAASAGARAVVPTSGGGFALMIEAFSLAGMWETPIVVVLAMRPGPATGLPTRTEQGDLNMALYAGHGDFARAIYAPGDIPQCFHLSYRAFDTAERYQVPVVLLTDQYLADSFRAVAPFDLDALPEVAEPMFEAGADYERYKRTDSGISPRLVPGFSEGLVVLDSDEHTEDGHITEDLGVRNEMVQKRLRKLETLRNDALAPDLYGNPDELDNATLLVCFGSTLGAALEAAEIMRGNGHGAAVLHFTQVYPLKAEQFRWMLDNALRPIAVEGNVTGQLAELILKESGYNLTERILRSDGLPFTANYIIERL